MICFNNLSIPVETSDYFSRSVHLLWPGIGDLIEDNHVGEFYLVRQKVDKGSIILCPHSFTSITQEIVARIVVKQVYCVDDGDHGVKACDI